ncbi:DUF2283 domain-containing protein [Persephonella sp.]|uniref:DUF2283 domain-containing protein n=1 Tax=Persephonella sp. TaxID=2060922 RepID=UPI0025E1E4E2|nr:DUF2283 domain-containing protein [Persephonella sp.]
MKLEYDKEANALYIKLTDKKIAYTEEITPNIIVDYSEDNKPVGIEILNANREINKNELKDLLQVVG